MRAMRIALRRAHRVNREAAIDAFGLKD